MKTLECTLDQYSRGAITGHECAMEVVRSLDPTNVDGVLQSLPVAVRAELHSWFKNWNGGNIRTTALEGDLQASNLALAKHWFDDGEGRQNQP